MLDFFGAFLTKIVFVGKGKKISSPIFEWKSIKGKQNSG
jgi:hypothetical protein